MQNTKKRYWKDDYRYLRVLEILESYWITEPDEKEVVVDMHFEHINGECQDKHIVWRNPKYTDKSEPLFLTAMDILMEER